MKVFHISWNDPETVFHEMPWKKNFTVYPSLNMLFMQIIVIIMNMVLETDDLDPRL